MQTQKLVSGLLAQFSPEARSDHGHREELEQVIESLRQRRDDLQSRLADETRHAQLRHLKIDLEVVQLQYRKALELRAELPQP
ncbi:MAG: hypothetical protein QNJ91_10540 [Gammaproteobacteria bacterium]|nr:hypothetical protein [Gammaproteobacteria bacterium]